MSSHTVPPPDTAQTVEPAAPDRGLSECLAALRRGPWRFIQLRGHDFDTSMINDDDVDLLGSRASVDQLLAGARDWMRRGLCHFRVASRKADKVELTLFSIDGQQRACFDLWIRLPQFDRGQQVLAFENCIGQVLDRDEPVTRLPVALEACVYTQHLVCKRKDLASVSAQHRLTAYVNRCRAAGEQLLSEQLEQVRRSRQVTEEFERFTLLRLADELTLQPRRDSEPSLLTRLWQKSLAAPRRTTQISIMGCDGAGKTTLAERLTEQQPNDLCVFTGKHLYRKSLTYKLAVIFLRPLITRSRERFDEILAPALYLRACFGQRLKAQFSQRRLRPQRRLTLIDRSLADFLYVNRKTDQPSFCRSRWLSRLFGQRIPTIHCHVSNEILVTRKQEMTPTGHAAYDRDMFEQLTRRTPTDYVGFHNDLSLDEALIALRGILTDITSDTRFETDSSSASEPSSTAARQNKEASDADVSTAAA